MRLSPDITPCLFWIYIYIYYIDSIYTDIGVSVFDVSMDVDGCFDIYRYRCFGIRCFDGCRWMFDIYIYRCFDIFISMFRYSYRCFDTRIGISIFLWINTVHFDAYVSIDVDVSIFSRCFDIYIYSDSVCIDIFMCAHISMSIDIFRCPCTDVYADIAVDAFRCCYILRSISIF